MELPSRPALPSPQNPSSAGTQPQQLWLSACCGLPPALVSVCSASFHPVFTSPGASATCCTDFIQVLGLRCQCVHGGSPTVPQGDELSLARGSYHQCPCQNPMASTREARAAPQVTSGIPHPLAHPASPAYDMLQFDGFEPCACRCDCWYSASLADSARASARSSSSCVLGGCAELRADSARDISRARCRASSSLSPFCSMTAGGEVLRACGAAARPPLAEAGEEGLSAGRAAPLLDAATVLEEDAWALATAACPALESGRPAPLQSWSRGCRCLRQ